MDDTLEITYSYRFQDERAIDFPIVLKKETLSLLNIPAGKPPFWADLELDRCSVCSLDSAGTMHCPIAVNLAPVVEAFKDFYSYESVHVLVTTRERSYSKSATIQEG